MEESDRMMTMCLIFGEKMIQVICVYVLHSRKPYIQKDKLVYKYDIKGTKASTLGIGHFNGHDGKKVDGFEDVHEGNRFGEQNLEDRMLLKFCK